jgi:hypothetical protein
MEAIDRLGQKARRRRFAGAARATEKVSVADAIGRYAIAQRARHVFLADYVVKSSGTPFTIQGLGHGFSLTLRTGRDKTPGRGTAV